MPPPPLPPPSALTPRFLTGARASPAHCWEAQGYYFDGLLGTGGQAESSLYAVFK